MYTGLTQIITQGLPQTAHTPQLLLKSGKQGVQVYTNYPCVAGLSPQVCATHFNEVGEAWHRAVHAHVHGAFVRFTLEKAYIKAALHALEQTPVSAPAVTPDEDAAGYWRYVIQVILETYPGSPETATDTPADTQMQQDLAILLIYMAERPENKQKRQAELISRLTVLCRQMTYGQMSQDMATLLRAAQVMLLPTGA